MGIFATSRLTIRTPVAGVLPEHVLELYINGSRVNPRPIEAWPSTALATGDGLGPDGEGADGWGSGGVGDGNGLDGSGPDGYGSDYREFVTPPRPDGLHVAAAVAVDPAGNVSSVAAMPAASVVLAGEPKPISNPAAAVVGDDLVVTFAASGDDES